MALEQLVMRFAKTLSDVGAKVINIDKKKYCHRDYQT